MYKSMLSVVVLVGALILATPAEAVITFERTYGGINWDCGNSVQKTQDGGYIIAGETRSFGTNYSAVYLIKTDAGGDTVWTKTYGGTNYDCGNSVQETQDGGFIIAGLTESFGAGSGDVWLIKTNAVGDTIWTKTYGGTGDDCGMSVQKTQDGGYIIAGWTGSFGAGGCDVWLIKTNSIGDTVWTKTYGGTDYDCGNSVQETQDGGYIIAGETISFGAGVHDVYLIKTDSLGNTVWTKTYGGTNVDGGCSVQETQDGGYIIAGWTRSFGAGSGDVYFIKTYSVGDTVWTKTYGGTDWDIGFSVQETQDGGYIIAGETYPYLGVSCTDVWLIKTDAVGDTVWTKTYGDTLYYDGGSSVQETQDGGYIIAGYTESFGAGSADVYLIKTDSLGNTGIEEESASVVPELYGLCQNHPNPFTTSTTIAFTLPGAEGTGHPDGIVEAFHGTSNAKDTELKIYDVSGRLVKSFSLFTPHSSLISSVSWDGKDNSGNELQGGVYFIRLTSGDFISIRKLILLR